MINLIVLLFLLALVLTVAKKFYFPTQAAQNPEKYPPRSGAKISKKELSTVMSHLHRWKQEGKISREEYDHLTDVCLAELQPGSHGEEP